MTDVYPINTVFVGMVARNRMKLQKVNVVTVRWREKIWRLGGTKKPFRFCARASVAQA